MGNTSANEAVHLSADGNYNYGASDGCGHYGYELVGDEAYAVHQAHACGNEKEAEVVHKEPAQMFDLTGFHDADLQGGREEQHADYARGDVDAGGPYDKFTGGKKCQ